MMTILQIYCVQRIGPANPHWAIYYFKAIVHNPNQVIIYVKNAQYHLMFNFLVLTADLP